MITSIRSADSASDATAIQELRSRAAERMLKAADANQDGEITESELSQVMDAKGKIKGPSAAQIIRQLDQGNKGYLTRQDLEAGLAAAEKANQSEGTSKSGRAGRRAPPPGGGGGGGGGASAPVEGASSTSTATSFDPEDLNQDGTVTNQEKLTYALKLYTEQQQVASSSSTAVYA